MSDISRSFLGLTRLAAICALVLPSVLTCRFADAANPVDQYNVVWDSPSKDSSGSMPLGNGDIGLNVWAEQGGDRLFYIGKSDAWSGICRLLKLGRVRIKLNPNPFAEGLPFRQTLDLHEGRIEIVAGPEQSPVTLHVWVDANAPVIYVEAQSDKPFDIEGKLEVWRTERRKITDSQELHSARGLTRGDFDQIIVEPDTVVPDRDDRIVWYHRNGTSIWPVVAKVQALQSVMKPEDDPLLHRTFGGLIEGGGLTEVDATTLRSAKGKRRTQYTIAIHVLTAQTDTLGEWLSALEAQAAKTSARDFTDARAAHRRWWDEFWKRSWIRVTGSEKVAWSGYRMPKLVRTTLPFHIGADSQGQSRFVGDIGRSLVYGRALSPEEIAAHAAGKMPPAGKAQGSVADWDFNEVAYGTFRSVAPGHFTTRVVIGEVEVVDGPPGLKSGAVRLDGGAYLEVRHCRELDLEEAVTLEAWIRPKKTAGRILDKTKVGTADGYMIDTYPGNALRLVVPGGNLQADVKLAEDRWAHVVGVYDAKAGRKELYLDGKLVAKDDGRLPSGLTREYAVSRGYALQRFIAACAGRGAFPIKFNGSLFTVDAREGAKHFDADYRRWGGCYWFQNTRLPYWPMLASGDFEMMRPLFAMYRDALPLAQSRTRIYYDHGGAFFPETMHFWATPANCDYGWNRGSHPDGFVVNSYIRYYWSGGLELTAMMLDHYAFTGDREFLEATLLPLASQIVRFYDEHYPRDDRGKIRFEPAASLETWHVAVNPLPEIAGLKFVLTKLLDLPDDAVSEEHRKAWERLLGELPPIPAGKTEDGKTYVLPAAEYSRRANSENPELYAVFPYRLFGLGKPDLEVGRLTFERRMVKGTGGWRQDSIQAAMLGLTDTARDYTVKNFTTWNPGSRFPAFWGPNFDWIPDQDHGSVALMALQTMLMQTEGRKILLLPAWPPEWNVEFKLHAPLQTTVEGVYRDGKLHRLDVTPPERANDVEVVAGG